MLFTEVNAQGLWDIPVRQITALVELFHADAGTIVNILPDSW